MKRSQTSRRRIRVGVIFGGRSAEHEVSLVSAASVINALDKKKFEIVPIGITPGGRWISGSGALKLLAEGGRRGGTREMILLPDPSRRGLMHLEGGRAGKEERRIDVIFPLVHGTYGEDGTLQGLLELADVPYVGSGVLGSAVCMDKVVAKQLCERAGIPVAPYLWFLWKEYTRDRTRHLKAIEGYLRYPCFIKPANLGSSVGITKAHSRRELIGGLALAARYDKKILVETGIEDAREIEVSVLGNDEPISSVPGEIIPSNEFYDYDAKYVDGKSRAVIPAELPAGVVRDIRSIAVRGFRATGASGMARIDFLVTRAANRIILNEINTIPGFTSISMYPKLWAASGIPYGRLLEKLIAYAIERHGARKALTTRYRPKKDWYRG